MKRIQGQKHTKETLIVSVSRLFERAGFYGIRGIIFYFLTDGSYGISEDQGFAAYSTFTAAVSFAYLLGGLVGDFLLGTKRAIITGGILQVIGAIALCFQQEFMFYSGLIMLVIGTGLYSPNILSQYGRIYKEKTNLLHSAFSLQYIAVNIGSFLGVYVLMKIALENGYNWAILVAVFCFVSASILPLILKNTDVKASTTYHSTPTKNILKLVFTFFATSLFWLLYSKPMEELTIKTMAIKKTIAGEADTWQFFVLQETHVLFLLPIAFILTTIWTFYHFKNSFHLAFGFILAALSIIVLMQVPEAPKPNHINYLYTFGFLMAFSEILIVPVVLSAVVKYVPSRYAATWIGFSFLAPFLISYLVNNINDILKVEFYIPIEFNLKSNFTIYFLTGSAILVYYLFSRKKEPNKK